MLGRLLKITKIMIACNETLTMMAIYDNTKVEEERNVMKLNSLS